MYIDVGHSDPEVPLRMNSQLHGMTIQLPARGRFLFKVCGGMNHILCAFAL
jgi:hypothetical protein